MFNFPPKLLEWKKETSFSRNEFSHYVSCVGVVRRKPNGGLQAADTPLSYCNMFAGCLRTKLDGLGNA